MAEEHGFQAPEGHRLCANNCGFFGSPATQNYCSKCYHDLFKDSNAKPAVDSLFTLPPSSSSSAIPSPSSSVKSDDSPALALRTERTAVVAAAAAPQAAAVCQPNRCSTCRRKVGLTGFRCRCGITFCGTHRYPEQHGCTFDFKTMGREAIAKANPLIKAEKLEKI
ncbi:OLC1v1034248C1 [Oldenlandia corymbosa var. corymbosa]|uniref:OLC1v1034248C1 n=1 Tax=Oldenlandia corymbosa var. corymbosa TaxID=529605 RepID=A0AAV1CSS7_OLDCO|nr:OLC1v1034248C1 [Oldenlandia corymbosa var. corymbosa]